MTAHLHVLKNSDVELSLCRTEPFSRALSKTSSQIQNQRYFKRTVTNLPWIYFHKAPNGSGCTFTLTFLPRAITTFIHGKPRSSDIINTYINPEAEKLAPKALWAKISMASVLLEVKLVPLKPNPQKGNPPAKHPTFGNVPSVSNYCDSKYLIWVAGTLTN